LGGFRNWTNEAVAFEIKGVGSGGTWAGMAGAFGSAKRERPGLLGLGEILVATGLDQGLAKNGTNETGIAGCP
jgi:hypothetical protein